MLDSCLISSSKKSALIIYASFLSLPVSGLFQAPSFAQAGESPPGNFYPEKFTSGKAPANTAATKEKHKEAKTNPEVGPAAENNLFSDVSGKNNHQGVQSNGFVYSSETDKQAGRQLKRAAKYPRPRQILAIPSLSPEQQKELRKLYQEQRQSLTAIKEKYKDVIAMRKKDEPDSAAQNNHQTLKQRALKDPAFRQKIQTMRQELEACQKQCWEQTRRLLTRDQLLELEQMKQGELLPEQLKTNSFSQGDAMR